MIRDIVIEREREREREREVEKLRAIERKKLKDFEQ